MLQMRGGGGRKDVIEPSRAESSFKILKLARL
jgi:hypothetical protein